MKEIVVLWSHAGDPTIPPPVCPDTCRTVRQVVEDFKCGFGSDKLSFIYSEEIITGKTDNSGMLTVDGRPLEELVPLPDPSKYCGMACEGCGPGNTGGISSCKRLYEQVPESVLRLALSKAAGKLM